MTPFGEIVADPARGTFMGNRGGRIHRDDRTLATARWKSKQWIICLLAFKSWHREVMGEGYTELFFLDEVTALAAGHRPCFECRRAAAMDFATRFPGPGRSRAPEMDATLHRQRLGPRPRAPMNALPEGAMFARRDAAFAVRAGRAGRALRWTPRGYDAAEPLTGEAVTVLTPEATRAALSAGYAPAFHPSAAGFS